MNRVKSRRRSIQKRGSPLKGKSPFKKRAVSRLATDGGGSEADLEDKAQNLVANPGPPAPANIRVAVRVRPENERELVSNHR